MVDIVRLGRHVYGRLLLEGSTSMRKIALILLLLLSPAAVEAQSCFIPPSITIIASNPCWTFDRFTSEYEEAQQRVSCARWLVDKPFKPIPLNGMVFTIIEHPDVFDTGQGMALGVFKLGYVHVAGPNQIESSLTHELAGVPVICHELGPWRELLDTPAQL